MDNNNDGRILKSTKNILSGFAAQLINMLLKFIIRTLFIRYLSIDYLSINGLYSSILSMLSLAELGFGNAMTFSMYKPLADRDYKKLGQLAELYKQVYIIIGFVVLILGLSIIPFLNIIIKNKPDIEGLTLYYILFLADSVFSYLFFGYRNSVVSADQKRYLINKYNIIFSFIRFSLQLTILVLYRNYTLYLATQIICTIAQNIAISVYAERHYPIFHIKNNHLPVEERRAIFKDVRALMLQKISFKVLNTSDSLIISSFVGVEWVGLLSNYTIITEAIVSMISHITSGISASLGNYFAIEDKIASYKMFCNIEFLNYTLYGISSISLIILLSPFVELWIGEKYVLPAIVVIALILRFLVEGYMNILSLFRSTLGLFVQGQYIPVITAIINIALSIALSYPLGVAGILLATPLSRLCINAWFMPYVIIKKGFNKPVGGYYIRLIIRVVFLSSITGVLIFIKSLVFRNGVTISSFACMAIITSAVVAGVFWIAYRNTEEFDYFHNISKKALSDIIRKLTIWS